MGKEPTHAFRLVEEIEPAAASSSAGRQAVTERQRTPPAPRSSHEKVVTSPGRDNAHPRATRAGAASKVVATRETDPVEAAVTRAVSLLEYGDMSRRRLIRKLTDRDIPPEIAEQAADICEARGYLREADACLRRAEQGVRKGWGPRRITEDLYTGRYPRTLIEETVRALTDEVDFAAACAAVIRKKYHGVPDDRDDRRRMTAALVRLGYGMDDIRAAMTEVAAEDGE